MNSWRVGRCVLEDGYWRMTSVLHQDMSENAAKFIAHKRNKSVKTKETKYVAWDAGVVANDPHVA